MHLLHAEHDSVLHHVNYRGHYEGFYIVSSGREETRIQILNAARALLEGPRGASVGLEEVAKAAGVSRQSVYLYFGSRAGLLLDLVQHIDDTEGLEELAASVWQASTGAEALDALATLVAVYSPRIYGAARAVLAARSTDEAVAAAWDDRTALRRENSRLLVKRLSEEGSLADRWDVDSAADALSSLTSIHLWESLVVECEWTDTQYEVHLKDLLARTLLDH